MTFSKTILTSSLLCAALLSSTALADYGTSNSGSSVSGTSGRNDNWQSSDNTNRANSRLRGDSAEYSERMNNNSGSTRSGTDRSASSSYSRDDTSTYSGDSRVSRNLGGQNSRTTGDSLYRDDPASGMQGRRNPGSAMSDTTIHSSGSISQQGSEAGSTSGPGTTSSSAGSATGNPSTP